MGNKKATGFLCLRLVPCFAYVGAEDNRKGIPFVKIVSLLCKLIQFLMVALSVTVHKALILLVFLNHPYQSLAFIGFVGVFYVQMGTIWVHNLTWKHKNVSHGVYLIDGILESKQMGFFIWNIRLTGYIHNFH